MRVKVSGEQALAPEMAAEMRIEFVFQDALDEMAPEITAAAEQRVARLARWHRFRRKERIIGGAEIEVLHWRNIPGRPKADQVGFLPDARLGGVTV